MRSLCCSCSKIHVSRLQLLFHSLTQAFPYSVTQTHAYIHQHACKCLPQPALLPPTRSSSCSTGRQAVCAPQQRAVPACTAPQLHSCPSVLPPEACSRWDLHSSSSSQGKRSSMLILEKAHPCCAQCRKGCLWSRLCNFFLVCPHSA